MTMYAEAIMAGVDINTVSLWDINTWHYVEETSARAYLLETKLRNEDAHEHVERVLDIFSLFNIPGVSQDAVMLRVFPFTLTGAAKRWVDRLTLGAINTWELLKKAFIERYCPPSKTTKQLEDIHNFKQEGDESLYQSWEWYNDMI
ncbi:hypothetical protein Tco_0508845 [Tanacetum coccineum]